MLEIPLWDGRAAGRIADVLAGDWQGDGRPETLRAAVPLLRN